jgi:hypothetical protein
MTKTTENIGGVIGITNLAKNVNTEIGNYIEHFNNGKFGYSVRLTNNGAIDMSREIAQDFETNAININAARIVQVAYSFRKI